MPKISRLSRSVAGRTVIITGAASGMGLATANLFADEGANVALTDINLEGVTEAVARIEQSGGAARGWHMDIADRTEVANVVEQISDTFGGIDIIVNNAAKVFSGAIDDDGFEQAWDNSIDVILSAQMRVIRACLPWLRKSDSARIINISSTEGLGAMANTAAYTAAKHGVIGLTRSLALEFGSQAITVNCICPGPVHTGMTNKIPDEHKQKFARRYTALKRYADPEEIAHATLSLALPASSFITGAVLPVDGGLTIRNG